MNRIHPLTQRLRKPNSNRLNSLKGSELEAVTRARHYMNDKSLLMWRNTNYSMRIKDLARAIDFNLVYASIPESERPSVEDVLCRRVRLCVPVGVKKEEDSVGFIFSDGTFFDMYRETANRVASIDLNSADMVHIPEVSSIDGDVYWEYNYICPEEFFVTLCVAAVKLSPVYTDIGDPMVVPLGHHFHENDRVEGSEPFTPRTISYDHFVSIPPFQLSMTYECPSRDHKYFQVEINDRNRLLVSHEPVSEDTQMGDMYFLYILRKPYTLLRQSSSRAHRYNLINPLSERLFMDAETIGMVYYCASNNTFHSTKWTSSTIAGLYALFHWNTNECLEHLETRDSRYPVKFDAGRYVLHSDGYFYASTKWGKICIGHFLHMGLLLDVLANVPTGNPFSATLQWTRKENLDNKSAFHVYLWNSEATMRQNRVPELEHLFVRNYPNLSSLWVKLTQDPLNPSNPIVAGKNLFPFPGIIGELPVLRDETETEQTDDEEFVTKRKKTSRDDSAYFEALDEHRKKRLIRPSRGMRCVRKWWTDHYKMISTYKIEDESFTDHIPYRVFH